MKSFLLITLALLINDPKEIAKINALKKEAEAAFTTGDYRSAITKYSLLADSIGVDEDEIHLNLAHAYYHLGDTAEAKANYEKVRTSSDRRLQSIAYQQLGVMSKDAGKPSQALEQLKSAIKADPSNRDAIYDYEVVKKLLEDQQKQDQPNQDQKDGEDQQQNQDQNKENKDGEQESQDKEQGENQEQRKQENQDQEQQKQKQEEGGQEEEQEKQSQEQMKKLEEMGITEEKARQLLEAMRQSEIKYLQNQKRKATKRPPSGKPDW